MTAVAPKAPQGSDSPLFSKDDFLDFMETSSFLERAMENIREFIECRSDMFLQKKEKQQQILDYQTMKLESEKNEYINKSEALLKDIGELKAQLMQIEHSCFNVRNKIKGEKQTKKILKEKALDNKQKYEKFNKTADLYKTVISWYTNYLNLNIEFDQENLDIVTVSFKKCKRDFDPSIRLQLLDKNQYKVLATHPSIGKENNKQKIIQNHEIVPYIYKFWSFLQELKEK